MNMALYDIGFLIFFVIMLYLIFFCILKNVVSDYGAGLLIGILVFGIIGYNIWMNFTAWEVIKNIKTCP
jgi:hypothetical protein